jgi:hypothetical protein
VPSSKLRGLGGSEEGQTTSDRKSMPPHGYHMLSVAGWAVMRLSFFLHEEAAPSTMRTMDL